MGSHLETEDPRGVLPPHCFSWASLSSSLSASATWDNPSPQDGAAEGRMKRRAKLHVDASHPTASSSPIPPPCLEPLTSSYCAPYSSTIFVPSPLRKVLGRKSLGMSREFGFAFICGQILFQTWVCIRIVRNLLKV